MWRWGAQQVAGGGTLCWGPGRGTALRAASPSCPPTWLPVSMHCSAWPVVVFQKRMQRSAVPPPLTSRPCWWGDQAMAFTAAWCSEKRSTGCALCWCHTNSWLSLPPLASSRSSGDQRRPQTCMWGEVGLGGSSRGPRNQGPASASTRAGGKDGRPRAGRTGGQLPGKAQTGSTCTGRGSKGAEAAAAAPTSDRCPPSFCT